MASEKGVRVTSTLITGERDAVLVAAQFIESEAEKLVAMIRGSGPSASALIASDTSDSGTRAWLADTSAEGWSAWLTTLERLRALEPAVVIAGHDDPALPDDASSLAATAAYIQDFQRTVASSRSAEDVVKAMTASYPSLALPIVLEISAKAAFASRE